ncbi:hypothetical protein B0H11DRAFT_266250 [Mycena galericulata]|nr:hypothetical protein B0H11DRAFT_266250 [Mycena galericulata]
MIHSSAILLGSQSYSCCWSRSQLRLCARPSSMPPDCPTDNAHRRRLLARRPTHRPQAGYNPKIFLFPTSFMNSVTKMRNLHHVQASKTHARSNFTTTFSDRRNLLSNGSTSTSSGHSSPQTTAASVGFSSNGSSSSRSTPSSHNSIKEYATHRPQIRSNPRIQLSSLLANNHNRTYKLTVVQHPQKTAEFGHARLSRLPLTPPMVVQLTVWDSNGNSIIPEEELPFLIAHLSLFSENGLTPLDMGSSTTGPGFRQGMPQPILYDVSVKWRGRFQLGITLVRISRPDSSGIAEQGTMLAQARTSTFEVLPYHEYIAAHLRRRFSVRVRGPERP